MPRNLRRRVLDLTFSLTLLVMVLVLLVVALDPASGQRAGRLLARGLDLRQEDACPSLFGNAFWFECAAEVRRRTPPPAKVVESPELAMARLVRTTQDLRI